MGKSEFWPLAQLEVLQNRRPYSEVSTNLMVLSFYTLKFCQC